MRKHHAATRRALPAALAAALLGASPAAAQTLLTTEHVDLNMLYTPGATINTPGTWNMQARDDDNFIAYNLPDVRLVVPSAALQTRPAGSDFAFIGAGAGQQYYRLPASQDPNLLYLGVAAYGTATSQFDRYNPFTESKQRVNGTGRWIRLDLVSVTGAGGAPAPGTFSVWQSGDTGPNVFMSSFDNGILDPNVAGFDATDGITADDSLWVVASGHLHYNYGFSAPGQYHVSFRPSGYREDGNAATVGPRDVSSEVFTVIFNVDLANAVVPEPATALLLVPGLPALGLFRRRRHTQTSI